jgi:hypothetical protein
MGRGRTSLPRIFTPSKIKKGKFLRGNKFDKGQGQKQISLL